MRKNLVRYQKCSDRKGVAVRIGEGIAVIYGSPTMFRSKAQFGKVETGMM